MTYVDDLIREAERRAARREQGKPLSLTPEELERQDAIEDERLESAIQAECVREYRARGFVVYEGLKSKARIQPGHPDLTLFHPRKRWHGYHEVKTPTGRMRPDQVDFQRTCIATGVPHYVGGIEVLARVYEDAGV